MNEDREAARLWRINRTIHELVADRGYEVSAEEINVDLDSFKAEMCSNGVVDRNRLNFFTQHRDRPEERLFVFYSTERNVGVKTMRQFINILEEKNITRGIIIWSDKMTSAAKKLILEDFEEAFLLVNITHHQLVPKHEVLTQEEKQALLHR
ncbi:DNA-directed RNA polymerases II 24 kDa polypeptide (RNA polymerase II subunit 5) [Malassezia nana]|uniref:DNA-directed RNA polymerases I, II, and III subunit RPABC1 n=1 Tax=Malassezia nana TaxID=180528 RepID=A0AAF0EJS4_9BASI|nr:DNA-directed RNA polymerases II 24 kDa polypeptide (RNA polymerase II subunit 5) [Malassezia nana]